MREHNVAGGYDEAVGVTIHFDGQLLGEDAFGNLMATARDFAASHTRLTEPIELEQTKLLRVRGNEDEWDYFGPAKGIVLYPSEDCDPVRLEFDKDLYVQEYTKTQFAGVDMHLKVVQLLRLLKPFFRTFRVEDEGEYWETGNAQALGDHMNAVNNVIESELKKDPTAQVKVKTPDGRIIDLMT